MLTQLSVSLEDVNVFGESNMIECIHFICYRNRMIFGLWKNKEILKKPQHIMIH